VAELAVAVRICPLEDRVPLPLRDVPVVIAVDIIAAQEAMVASEAVGCVGAGRRAAASGEHEGDSAQQHRKAAGFDGRGRVIMTRFPL
jgi:hypothetical protein